MRLGSNARYWQGFVETLERMLDEADQSVRENRIFPLLKTIKPRSWFETIPRLLEQEDSDFLNLTHVSEYISRRDQSRLNVFLEDDLSPLFDLKSTSPLALL